MSRVLPEDINISEAGISPGTGNQHPPPSVKIHVPQEVPNFVDGSGPIFSMYLEMAGEEDKKMAEDWKADADGILIFTGLFSAAVASLISVSIQDIRPNPQDTSNFYLANIYQTIADPNRPNISLPSSPPTFSPPSYAVWVNTLWFLSLVISLTCALLATFLQQWARRYLKVIQPRYSPHKRARIRAFFAEGVNKFLLPWVVDALPTLVHISLCLFFIGLVVFLFNVNLTIFKLVLSWVGVYTAVYGCITVMPLFRHDSPYYTPLTSLVWPIVTGTLYVTFRVIRYFVRSVYVYGLVEDFRQMLLQGMLKTAEETARKSASEIDIRAFMWTLESLDEDRELERFFSGLPGFRSSRVVSDPLPSLTDGQKLILLNALIGLSDRTFSDLLPEPVKSRRAIICARALDPSEIPYAYRQIVDEIVFNDQYRGLQTAEFGRVMRGWGDCGDRDTALVVQAICTSIVARAQRHDDSWFAFASNELGVPEAVLRDYAADGDSLSLAILIYITRQQFSHFKEWIGLMIVFSQVLQAASKFNARDTSLGLQHKFCALWNQIVLHVQSVNDRSMAFQILGPIHDIYIALHQDSDAASTRYSVFTYDQDWVPFDPTSYPLCNFPGHHLGPNPIPHIHDDSTSTTVARTIVHDNSVLGLASPAGPDVLSLSIPAPLRISKSFADVSPLDNDNDIYVPGSFYHTHRTAIENLRIPADSPDPVTTRMIRDGIDTFATATPLSIPEPLASTPTSMVSTSPPGSIAAHHIADHHTASDLLDVPPSPSPAPVLNTRLSTDPHSSFDSPMTGSDHAYSSPEFHSLLLAPGVPGLSRPRLSSAPDLGAATEAEGSTKATLHKERDVLDAHLLIRESITAAADLPLLLPSSPSSVTDIATAGPSRHSLDDEHRIDNRPTSFA